MSTIKEYHTAAERLRNSPNALMDSHSLLWFLYGYCENDDHFRKGFIEQINRMLARDDNINLLTSR